MAIRCEECRERLLEADVAELRGGGSDPLAEHLRACDECRRRAELVVAEHDRLASALAAVERGYTPAEPSRVRRVRRVRGRRVA
ncbi:MAG: hypothetical protein ACRELV_04820, partial [Longimicrobiales bacterium]